ncbi:MAG: hypothetical protein CML20_00850 [Rheinheimera sp.]|uniref:hypothetical protein n=1 Tax=Arsukibacterium sp. UBA3155 TaxID=1946058 RepID=UPI000C935810|nr:hypothetical protein [Arsukibacterium sp. UBA3155]MAD73347.1 hypothetical protein [Rheinheimera sp.]|tara:strand:+ start:186204 stop:186806 length:603 start_codon:yes stop_codon:yes gene_type:complete
MTDNFDFAALAKSWQQQVTPADTLPGEADLAQARQRQHQQKLLMYGEWLGGLVMAAASCWLILAMPDALGYLAAAFLALGAVSTFYISWQVHRPILAYDNWSSGGLLQFRQRACQLSLRYYRYTQLSFVALLLFTAALWLLRWWQPATASVDLILFYSLIVSPLCLFGIYRLQQKSRVKAAELAHLTRLADDFNFISEGN